MRGGTLRAAHAVGVLDRRRSRPRRPRTRHPSLSCPHAGVAELVDAPGLGPGGLCPWRFESSHPHRSKSRSIRPRSLLVSRASWPRLDPSFSRRTQVDHSLGGPRNSPPGRLGECPDLHGRAATPCNPERCFRPDPEGPDAQSRPLSSAPHRKEFPAMNRRRIARVAPFLALALGLALLASPAFGAKRLSPKLRPTAMAKLVKSRGGSVKGRAGSQRRGGGGGCTRATPGVAVENTWDWGQWGSWGLAGQERMYSVQVMN